MEVNTLSKLHFKLYFRQNKTNLVMSSLQIQSWHRQYASVLTLLLSVYSAHEHIHLASATGPNGAPLFFGLFKEQTSFFLCLAGCALYQVRTS